MTTLVVYPDADPESSTVDGRLRHAGTNLTWAAVRDGAGTNSNDITTGGVSNSCGELEAGSTTDRWAQIERGAYLFDTSSIPSGSTISSQTLSLYGISKLSNLGETNLDVVASAPASNIALDPGDYDSLGASVFGTIAYGSFSTAGYNDIGLSGGVTKAGITKLGTRLAWDTNNSFGGVWSSAAKTSYRSYYADQTGTSNDPKLTVVYSTVMTANADLLDAALTVLEPAALRDWNLAGDLLDAAITVLEPAALRDWNLAGDLLDAAITVLDPSVGRVVYADLIDAAITVLEPAALRDWNLTGDLLDAAITVLDPSVGRVVYADLIDAAITVLEPAALRDWNLAGDLLDAAITVLDPSVSVAGLTSYGWIVGGYNLMQAAHKIQLLGEYDGLPGRRGADLIVSGQESRVYQLKRHDQRTISLAMWVAGATRAAYQANLDALLAALARSSEQTLRRGMPDGTERQIEVQLHSALSVEPQSDKFGQMLVDLVATSPTWRDADPTLASASGVSSLPYNLAVTNPGSAADVQPVITITPTGGTLTNPRLTVGSTWVQYTGSVTTGVTLTIDCSTWTATKGASNVAANISSAGVDWLRLEAGANTAVLSGSLSAGTIAIGVSFYGRWF